MKQKKQITLFECQNCGHQSTKWLGKCPNCNSWESFSEVLHTPQKIKDNAPATKALPITQVKHEVLDRFSSMQSELDIVLGGGIVKGGLYLIGGSPGVGKSTLLLKVAGDLASSGRRILYVSGEESLAQIHIRARRLNCLSDELFLLSEINIEHIKENLLGGKFEVCIIDSMQTIFSPNLSAAPGSRSEKNAGGSSGRGDSGSVENTGKTEKRMSVSDRWSVSGTASY